MSSEGLLVRQIFEMRAVYAVGRLGWLDIEIAEKAKRIGWMVFLSDKELVRKTSVLHRRQIKRWLQRN